MGRGVRNEGKGPSEEGEYFYAFLSRADPASVPQGGGRIPDPIARRRRTNFVFDAISARSFDSGDFFPEDVDQMPLLRVVTTQNHFDALVGRATKEGDWFRLRIVNDRGGPYVWRAVANPNDPAGFSQIAGERFLASAEYLPDGDEGVGALGPGAANPALARSGRRARSIYSVSGAWPPSRLAPTRAYLRPKGSFTTITAIDVGQANFISLHNRSKSSFYFDVGYPLWFNFRSLPAAVSFQPPASDGIVILSHWDFDHYSYARRDNALKNLLWIAPTGTVGPNTKKFADSLPLLATPPYGTPFRLGSIQLEWATGPLTDRNNSGIIALINKGSQRVLLTGDAAYDYVPSSLKGGLTGVSVPHHAAASTAAIPAPGGSQSRAVACTGRPNRYQHPVASVLDNHAVAKWFVSTTGSAPGYTRGNKTF